MSSTIHPGKMGNDRTDVQSIESKSHSHIPCLTARCAEMQYVITLSRTLEFTTLDGETFILRPGDVLVAEDNVGSGHK